MLVRTRGSIVLVAVAAVFVLVGLTALVVRNQISLQEGEASYEDIVAALEQKEVAGEVIIKQQSAAHVRGVVLDADGSEHMFLALTTGDTWTIVEYDNPVFSCERAFKLNFPSSFVKDCTLENPGAISVKQLVEAKETSTVTVVGKVSVDKGCNCLKVTSEGVTIEIPIVNISDEAAQTVALLDDGDTVVITGSVVVGDNSNSATSGSDTNTNSDTNTSSNSSSETSNSQTTSTDTSAANTDANTNTNTNAGNTTNTSSNSNVTVTVDDIEEVAPEDDDLVVEPNTDSDSDDTSVPGVSADATDDAETTSNESQSDTPSEPSGSGPSPSPVSNSFYQNLLDIDLSDVEVQLLND